MALELAAGGKESGGDGRADSGVADGTDGGNRRALSARKGGEEMKLQVVSITPNKARLWLQKNTKNRKLRQHHVDKLAADMAKGRWVLNGQTISFSVDGTLNDGQHRLHAIIKSGATIQSCVAFGVDDPAAFKTIDVNILKRGVDQILGMMGIENSIHISAIARRLLYWDNAANKSAFALTKQDHKIVSGDAIIEYAQEHLDAIRDILKTMQGSMPLKKCGAGSALLTALLICSRTDDVAALIFTDELKTGAGLQEDSPVYKLRERLIDPPPKRGARWETEVMALTIKSFNKFINGQTLKTLRWRQAGDAPEKFPIPGDKS